MSQRLTAQQALVTRQTLMFAEGDFWSEGDQAGNLIGRRLNMIMMALRMPDRIRRVALFSFRAPWCPVSLARLKTFSDRLSAIRPDFLLVALTLGSSQERQELSEYMPTGTTIFHDRDLYVTNALSLYEGKGLLKPGVVVVDRDGAVEWALVNEPRTTDWRRFAAAYEMAT